MLIKDGAVAGAVGVADLRVHSLRPDEFRPLPIDCRRLSPTECQCASCRSRRDGEDVGHFGRFS